MGVVSLSFSFSFSFSFFFFFSFFLVLHVPSFADTDSRKTPPLNTDMGAASNDSFPSPPPPPPPPPLIYQQKPNISPFRPSIAVIVGVLTTMFSVTFLLLLYAKHCRGGNDAVYTNHTGPIPYTARRNSGIDRTVVESLPIFRFASLRGQKDGLECAVCLTRFELTEVLRLLPKCKHAFHVECVDTWLDSHSTCPLCRYRVDPEDILLIEDVKIFQDNQTVQMQVQTPLSPSPQDPPTESEPEFNRRVSGRHSSAGERGTSTRLPQIASQDHPTWFRRSLDSARLIKKSESVAVGCFDRPRKDGLLLTDGLMADRKSFERRFEHRINIVSGGLGGGFYQRWSDVQPSDLLYLRSEKIISDSHRFSSGSPRPSTKRQHHQNALVPQHTNIINIDDGRGSGGNVINSRSVSEITGLSRFPNRESNSINSSNRRQRQAQAGLVSRWLAWISSQSQTAVRSDHSNCTV